MTYKKENLVALIFASNTCYTEVVELSKVSGREVSGGEMGEKPYTWKWAEIDLDLEKGTWRHGKNKEGRIGGSCRYESNGSINGYGLIGIYDRTNLDHLDSMVHDGKEATGD